MKPRRRRRRGRKGKLQQRPVPPMFLAENEDEVTVSGRLSLIIPLAIVRNVTRFRHAIPVAIVWNR